MIIKISKSEIITKLDFQIVTAMFFGIDECPQLRQI